MLSVKQKMPNLESVKQRFLWWSGCYGGVKSFDGETGYIQGPQGRMDMDDETISKMKAVQGIFEELYYADKQLELINISNIDGDDAYKDKNICGSDISYRYYSISRGYLLSVESEDKSKNVTTTNYSDFNQLKGCIFLLN